MALYDVDETKYSNKKINEKKYVKRKRMGKIDIFVREKKSTTSNNNNEEKDVFVAFYPLHIEKKWNVEGEMVKK